MQPSAVYLFSQFVPFDVLEKAATPGNSSGVCGYIGGYASAEARDFQGEIIVQSGVDWSYFKKHGKVNWEHQPGPENVVGLPEDVRENVLTPAGVPATWIEAAMLDTPRVRVIMENALAIQKATTDTGKRFGFSVEGQALDRDPLDRTRITKARVLNVTITAHPIQPDSRLEVLARSLTADVGYQTPTGTAGGEAGSLSALVPQSAVGDLTNARKRGRVSAKALASMLRLRYPQVSVEKAHEIADRICDAVG